MVLFPLPDPPTSAAVFPAGITDGRQCEEERSEQERRTEVEVVEDLHV